MTWIAAGVAALLAAGVSVAATERRAVLGERLFSGLFTLGCVLIAGAALRVLAGFPASEVRFDAAVPGGPWVFGVDALSALFLLAIAGVGLASALYGVSYLRPERGRRWVGGAHLLVAVLVAALTTVVTARAAIPFLVAWEVMAIAAYALVVHEHERAEIRRAGLLYLAATHAATLALFGLFAAWASGGGELTFDELASRAPLLPAGGAFVLTLAFVGFGLKAGAVPLHFWLPDAHAASPSHVSALMSGLVIKMGVYGLLRVISLIGPPPAWFGWLVLLAGVGSGVLGVVWALAQHDLKRLLAYHSVENIGIILMGMGAGALGLAYGNPATAVLGFGGAALHTLNHALFKGLLFLGAGSVAHGTGTREIEHLGGLARAMPATAAAFLVGSAAIVGLPPLNGFLSEWLVFRSLLSAGAGPTGLRPAAVAAAALGLIGALALACFAKVFGVIFLGAPRSASAASAHESPDGMVRAAGALAGACALVGVLPAFVIAPVLRAGAVVAGAPAASIGPLLAGVPALTAFMLALAAGTLALWLARERAARAQSDASPWTWGCGYPAPTARMQYTASSFAQPLLAPFAVVAGIRTRRTASSFATHARDQVLEQVLLPSWRGLRSVAALLRPIQRSRLSVRLVYLEVVLIALLLYLLLPHNGAP